MIKDMTAIVAAAAPNRGIGYQGQLPWRLPGDMKHFKRVTTMIDTSSNDDQQRQQQRMNAVIMGRKTWDSIPPKFRPLEGRINVVLTRSNNSIVNNNNFPQGVIVASSLQDACDKLAAQKETSSTAVSVNKIFVIGGAQIYQQAMDSGYVKSVVYTEIVGMENEKFDAFFPDLPTSEWEMKPYGSSSSSTSISNGETTREVADNTNNKENDNEDNSGFQTDAKSGIRFRFLEFSRKFKNHEEMQYLDLCREIIDSGIKRGDRTGTGTLSKFGTQMRFSLRNDTLPLLTTKRTFWRGVAEELLWFVSGNTNANDLAAKDIHIWDGNGSREFLDERGLNHREVGDLGPVYGFQWRHFGAEYVDMHTDYAGKGVDQLADCIDKIKNNPEDRRIIMSAWNPADLDKMALPPCHMFCQFYVDTEKNELSCQMYQRSADLGLGVPFNIASYALLTRMVAQVTGRKPGDFIHTIGDAHIYLNHVEALKEQLEREPRAFPKLKINPEKTDIDSFEFSDFEVIGYKPHKTIKMKMAV